MTSVRISCLFALEDLERQLVAKLAPAGVQKGRISSLMSRHHDALLESLMGQVEAALKTGLANGSPARSESSGETRPLKVSAYLLGKLQELASQTSEPFLIYVDLGDGGEMEMVEVRPEAKRLVIVVDPDYEVLVPGTDARPLLNRIPLARRELSGGSIAIVSNSVESFSDPPGGGK